MNNFRKFHSQRYIKCQTPVLGLGLGVDFNFTWDNKNNNNNNNNNNKNTYLNFLERNSTRG